MYATHSSGYCWNLVGFVNISNLDVDKTTWMKKSVYYSLKKKGNGILLKWHNEEIFGDQKKMESKALNLGAAAKIRTKPKHPGSILQMIY